MRIVLTWVVFEGLGGGGGGKMGLVPVSLSISGLGGLGLDEMRLSALRRTGGLELPMVAPLGRHDNPVPSCLSLV